MTITDMSYHELSGRGDQPHLTTTSLQGVVESNKISSEPPLLQKKQFQIIISIQPVAYILPFIPTSYRYKWDAPGRSVWVALHGGPAQL